MEMHHARQNTFTGAADGGADTGSPAATLFPSEAPLDGSTKFYDLTIEAATATSFTLRATPKNAQAGTGYLELLSTGAKRWDRNVVNNTIDTTTLENTWD